MIYSRWAFTDNEKQKMQYNREIYNSLGHEYRIYRNDCQIELADGEDCDFANYDVIIGRKAGYHHSLYKVYKNDPNLSEKELALVCDGGNLCFGYTMDGGLIRVFED